MAAQPVPFGGGEPAPHPVPLIMGQGVAGALPQHWAGQADSLGQGFPQHRVPAVFFFRREEQVRVFVAAGRLLRPRSGGWGDADRHRGVPGCGHPPTATGSAVGGAHPSHRSPPGSAKPRRQNEPAVQPDGSPWAQGTTALGSPGLFGGAVRGAEFARRALNPYRLSKPATTRKVHSPVVVCLDLGEPGSHGLVKQLAKLDAWSPMFRQEPHRVSHLVGE